jgi:hypothetical protein
MSESEEPNIMAVVAPTPCKAERREMMFPIELLFWLESLAQFIFYQ